MKHVVFAHRKLSYGGGERVLLEQVAALAGLPVKVTVLFRKEPGRRDIEPELRARNPNLAEVLHLPGAIGAFRWLWKARPDLLVLCNHKGVQRALPWLARFGVRIPCVLTLHEHYERHLRKYRGVRNLVDRWLCTYDFTAAVREHLSAAPCSIIHPLYPRAKVDMVDATARRAARCALRVPEDAAVVGYAGQMDARKATVDVIRFASRLAGQLSGDFHLLLAGREDASYAREIQDALEDEHLVEHCTRTGPLKDLAPAFAALDLYVMTSRNEGFFPIALIEALERGVPVLAPTVGGIGSVLKDGEGGFLLQKPDDRQAVPEALLEAAAARLAPLLADAEAWENQRAKAHGFGTALTRDYDAAAKFREAVAEWL
ncbi:MAG: glycosyltransferase family 4 protein [Holophagaceae bacterium]|uniref:Glycosyltransferase family 4 protein n=1 Tax=Candidatus Geothrix skivensis TaxID=2954439 RepID=A0A9D7SIB5_9BACT|nr:glycosyltransferase family 4 protein [Candidatus Geothrix skivensis]